MKHCFDYFEGDGPQSRIEIGGRRILCKGGGGGGSSTTVQSIPEELKPLATAYTDKAIDLGDQGYTPYTNQRYADFNQAQNRALGMVEDRAAGGSRVMNAGEDYLANAAGGAYQPANMFNPYAGAQTNVGANSYAGQNKYLEGAINRSLDDVQTRVNSQFNGSNYGTSAHQETLARALGDTSNAMRMQDYGTQQQLAENALNRSVNAQQTDLARNASLMNDYAGRDLQAYQLGQNTRLNAAQLAPTYGNQAYTDAAQLLNAGQVRQDQAQQGMDFDYSQFQEQQNLPYKQLAAMSGVFGSNLGSTSSTQQKGGGGK